MKIESDDYYRIVLSSEYHAAGTAFLEEIVSDLSANQRSSDIDFLRRNTETSYQVDTRCLICFALAHDEYEFGIGGLSHVIGHEVVKPLRIVERLTREMAHRSHEKIAKMIEAVESVPRNT